MILNHKRAIELLVDQAALVAFNRFTLLNLHATLSENLLGDPSGEGALRRRPVGVTGTTFVPLAIPQRIEELFDVFLGKASAIPDPFEQALFALVHIPYLQPFIDVNRRTSRLAANIPLIKANLCPLSFVDLPERAYVEAILGVYEQRDVALLRDVFVWAYEHSCAQYKVVRESLGDPDPIRLRYRSQLSDVVRAVVTRGEEPGEAALRDWAEREGIDTADRERFATTAMELLLTLHEGSIARYGIRPSEFARWNDRASGPIKPPNIRS